MDTDTRTNAEPFLPTRQSLLSRLKDWDNQDSWRQFFDTYWQLIYDMARKAGLADAVAQDVVQETVLAAAKQLPEFKYDRSKGSFKGWLRQITRRRIADALRQQYRHGQGDNPGEDTGKAEETDNEFEARWESEWQAHLAQAALNRVKSRANPLHFQAFELLSVQGWSPLEVARTLKVNLAQVYLIRSRMRRLVRDELERLETDGI